ncbi:hypothetical protein BD310DRAFT_498671 [Dichomitus squalens]|uniref:Uncharacterized protein n=2 Tax=Dichomitus squalens TaxID=114155 RepID=A0A4Q9PUG4_9APHY|nr:hypothetical protein BD310DRAFT_498671 [Dichomitus squalens]
MAGIESRGLGRQRQSGGRGLVRTTWGGYFARSNLLNTESCDRLPRMHMCLTSNKMSERAISLRCSMLCCGTAWYMNADELYVSEKYLAVGRTTSQARMALHPVPG